MTVRTFEPINSLDGKKYGRKDANGDACALIKVGLARAGATFEGNVVGSVRYEQSEYWVYMYTGSTKMLTVKVEGALPLKVRFADYGISHLEPNRTYSLVITLPNVREADLEANYFVLTVTPSSAIVSIDGKELLSRADGSYIAPLTPGQHSYSIKAAGYQPVNKTFLMGQEKKTEAVTLTSDLCRLIINCKSTDAEIFINDERRGKGNWEGLLPSGNYIVEARQKGHQTVRKFIQLENQKRVTCQLEAPERISGSLNVVYRPIESEIWIDGQHRDNTPAKIRLSEGQHRVEIRQKGYRTFAQQVDIRGGEVRTLEGELKKDENVVRTEEVLSSTTTTSNLINGHEYVDLGLPSGTLWATCNVGASKPEDYGDYFAWGATSPQSVYDWVHAPYQTQNTEVYSSVRFTKYLGSTTNSFLDKTAKKSDALKTILDLEDDAAHVNWGGGWYTPTQAEQKELMKECIWAWSVQKGVNGYRVISKRNNNSIFLPAAGFGYQTYKYKIGSVVYYWSSTLVSSDANGAYVLSGDEDHIEESARLFGLSVRPVHKPLFEQQKNTIIRETIPQDSSELGQRSQKSSTSKDAFNGHDYVDLGLKDIQGRTIYWATCNVGADTPEDPGLYFAWGETIGYGNDPRDGHFFSWDSYKWGEWNVKKKKVELTKYTASGSLDAEDDAAHINWGGSWRMPTPTELEQLLKQCTWKWDDKKKGYIVKGKNGNTIFLPAAGDRIDHRALYAGQSGHYWSGWLYGPENGSAICLDIDKIDQGNFRNRLWHQRNRYIGQSVRAVCVF